jgi:hypothetical protein
MKKRRKTVTAFACVGSHGLPFCTAITRVQENQGRFEIFETYEQAKRMALSPAHVRRVKIYIEQEPALS